MSGRAIGYTEPNSTFARTGVALDPAALNPRVAVHSDSLNPETACMAAVAVVIAVSLYASTVGS